MLVLMMIRKQQTVVTQINKTVQPSSLFGHLQSVSGPYGGQNSKKKERKLQNE